jgi:hypothetical protein
MSFFLASLFGLVIAAAGQAPPSKANAGRKAAVNV